MWYYGLVSCDLSIVSFCFSILLFGILSYLIWYPISQGCLLLSAAASRDGDRRLVEDGCGCGLDGQDGCGCGIKS